MPFSPNESDAQPQAPASAPAGTAAADSGVWSSLAGAPFLALSLTPLLVFGQTTVLAAFLSTALAAFTVHIPVIAGSFGLTGEEYEAAPLPARAYALLLLLWAITNWVIAALWR